MRNVRAASEHEVVLTFLRGEIDSPRFASTTRAALERTGGIELVTQPDLTSPSENAARRSALAEARGWGSDGAFFAGFPDDVSWQHGQLDVDELERVRFINYSYWIELSGGTRRPADVAGALEQPERLPAWMVEMGTEHHVEFAGTIQPYTRLVDLIIVGTPDLAELVVLEGHARLAALFLSGHQREVPVTAYVGTSPDIHAWSCF